MNRCGVSDVRNKRILVALVPSIMYGALKRDRTQHLAKAQSIEDPEHSNLLDCLTNDDGYSHQQTTRLATNAKHVIIGAIGPT